jgi:hypothetical protein
MTNNPKSGCQNRLSLKEASGSPLPMGEGLGVRSSIGWYENRFGITNEQLTIKDRA